ncbi:MAG TPA: hypothetical protein VK970_06400 [Candidatus Methylacidiphilales bacterium]|nr:hypothetical protein [Candidatus Methylacidiphilales bacterium]
MKTISLDLRERIVACCDEGTSTQKEIAERFCVSLAMVKKLLSQRRATGSIAPRKRAQTRHSMFTLEIRRKIEHLISRQPEITLAELRQALDLTCTLPAIHYALKSMGLTYRDARRWARVRRAQAS